MDLKEYEKSGCDFTININEKRKINLLQITDMQIIDSWQRRTFNRIRPDEINAWSPESFDIQCGNHIRSLIAQTSPDLILITGDIIYGSFDDNGTVFEWFCSFMDSFKIPWAPVFGNHDNESAKGVGWQCGQLEKSKYCLFKRGAVSGNSNYCVGIAAGGTITRVIYMLDTNGCKASNDPDVIKTPGIYPDQIKLIKDKAKLLESSFNKKIPAFLALHIPVEEFEKAEIHNGYRIHEGNFFTIGVDVPKKNNDFGFRLEPLNTIKTDAEFLSTLKQCNIDGVFAGHCHNISTSIRYEDIIWTFGLKTGQYDYHIPGQLGGTLIQLEDNLFEIHHVPSLVYPAPFPGGAGMFKNFFSEDNKILKDGFKKDL